MLRVYCTCYSNIIIELNAFYNSTVKIVQSFKLKNNVFLGSSEIYLRNECQSISVCLYVLYVDMGIENVICCRPNRVYNRNCVRRLEIVM